MNRKIRKLVVISSMLVGLLIMKIRFFKFNLGNGVRKRYQKMELKRIRVNNISFSKTAFVTEEE